MKQGAEDVDRQGCPNPLIYYLHAAALAHQQAIALSAAKTDTEHWAEHLKDEGTELLESLDPLDVAEASCTRLKDMLKGIDLWRGHPYRRSVPDPKTVWSHQSARLLDFGDDTGGKPLFVIPSLINRHYILDLMEDVSFVRSLQGHGLRPLLLDWGDGARDFATYSLDTYTEQVLLPAFDHVSDMYAKPVSVLGYCMGGTLAVGLASLIGDRIERLALLGTPWDFDAMPGVAQMIRQQINFVSPEKARTILGALDQCFGAIPHDLFQYLFAVLAPTQVVQKFARFSQIDPSSHAARKFVAVEDWLSDGQPLPSRVAEAVLIDWYVENQPGWDTWKLCDQTIDPRKIGARTLIVTGQRDHIVPPAVSAPLAHLIGDGTHLSVPTGHVGMIVGASAYADIARRLSTFFCE